MKRAGNLIGQISDFDNLLLAFYKAQKGKKAQSEVVSFRENLHENLHELSRQIIAGDVTVGRFRKFVITDPKRREICAVAFAERVLHHAMMNICQPIFERNLIYDTYATRVGNGVYMALERAKKAMPKYAFVAKLDVRKYFDSISHDELKALLGRLFKEAKLLNIFSQIIDSYETRQGCGLPIGNLTSQYLANYYLSGLDHYAKEVMRVPVYVRYMDDILVFGSKRDEAERFVTGIIEYASGKLHLEFKPPVILSTSESVSFLGYRLCGYRIGLNGRSKKRFAKKMKLYQELLERELWSEREFYEHIVPLLAFVKYSYSKKYRKRSLQIIEGQELKGSEPRASWRKLEQQRFELPCNESQQQ